MHDLDRLMPELTRSEYRERIRMAEFLQRLPKSRFPNTGESLIECWRDWVGEQLIALGMRLKSNRSRQETI